MQDAALRRDGRVPLSYSYRLFLRPVQSAINQSSKVSATCVLDSKETSHICTDLHPNTLYEVYVETYCIPIVFPGEGPRCKAVVVKTCECPPDVRTSTHVIVHCYPVVHGHGRTHFVDQCISVCEV